MTITEFLLARIDEDETRAQFAHQGDWEFSVEPIRAQSGIRWARIDTDIKTDGKYTSMTPVVGGVCDLPDEVPIEALPSPFTPLNSMDGLHIARWGPPRALAECKAKRSILDDHSTPEGTCPTCDPERSEHNPCTVLCHLAAVYADHPDYQEEWRP